MFKVEKLLDRKEQIKLICQDTGLRPSVVDAVLDSLARLVDDSMRPENKGAFNLLDIVYINVTRVSDKARKIAEKRGIFSKMKCTVKVKLNAKFRKPVIARYGRIDDKDTIDNYHIEW